MTAKITGIKQLRARLHNIQNGREILGKLQTDVAAEAKRATRPFSKTRNLSQSIKPGYLSDREAFVVAGVRYAVFVEKGTGIYGPKKKPIVPKRAKVLAWRTGATTLSGASRIKNGKQVAGWAFAKSVKGREATPFMEPGAKAAATKGGLRDVVIQLWNEAA